MCTWKDIEQHIIVNYTFKKENMNNEVQTIDRIIHLITYQIVMQM
jgi:hypothetical protein